MKKGKKLSIIVTFSAAIIVLLFGYNNCGKKASFSNPYDESNRMASSDAGNYLLDLLEEAKKIEARLLEQADIQATAQASELRKFIDNIEKLIASTGQNLPVDHKHVLDQRDYLVNSMAKGRELLIIFNFTAEVARLDAADKKLREDLNKAGENFSTSLKELEARLKLDIENLQSQINTMKSEFTSAFEAFKLNVEARFTAVNNRIDGLERRIDAIDQSIHTLDQMLRQLQGEVSQLRTTTEVALLSLKSSLEALKANTEAQIAKLMELNNDLNAKLLAQQKAFDAYVKAQTTISSLPARMCKVNAETGLVASGEKVCANQDEADAGGCCLTAANVNCSLMFPEETDVAEEARNQCSNVLITMKNSEAMAKELAEREAEQNALIEQLIVDVQNLEQRMDLVEKGMEKLSNAVETIQNKIADMDARLLIVEFKAARGEAVATLNERSDLYLAWIARRRMDVQQRFCDANAETAYNRSDYQSAKHNWVYCQERLKWLTEANELVQIAKAYSQGVASTNVDTACSLSINGKNVDAMSVQEILVPANSEKIIKGCKSGQALVMALMGNIIKLQNRIGPDFRTAEYMAMKAKIGQMIYFGTVVSSAGVNAIRAFENIDPTTVELRDTYYGRIERVFKNRYIETRLRTSAGKFPSDPSQIAGSVAGLSLAYSEAEIKAGSTAYLARLRPLEIEANCAGQCGFKVVARNDVRAVGSRFSYPKDAETKCPIIDETVMVQSNDKKYYGFALNYTRYKGATEELTPRLTYGNNSHHAVAASPEAAARGEFLGCGYRVRHIVDRFGIPDALLRGRHVLRYGKPYAISHGLPQCQRFHFSCHLWSGANDKGEWIAPNSGANILHYLSGLDKTRVTTMCKDSGNSYVEKERTLASEETSKIYVYKSNVNTDGVTLKLRQTVSSSTTQLTKDYWMLKDAAIEYGVNTVKLSKTAPFVAGVGSTSEHFLRGLVPMSSFGAIKVQQCYDPK